MAETRIRLNPSTRRDFLISCLLVCCALLTIASFTFAMYTVKEFATLKARASELEQSLSNIHLLIPNNDFSSKKSTVKSTGNLNKEESSKRKRTSATLDEEPTPTTKGTPLWKNQKNVGIHLTGKGYMVEKGMNPVTKWNVVYSCGNVSYADPIGAITINVPGLYLIYSQLQLVATRSHAVNFWLHETRVNHKNIMRSIIRPQNHKSKYQSNYQGGIFPLQKGDRVYISGQRRRETNHAYNFFGLYRLSNT